ncbi:Type I Iterative PKS [Diaporthe eres]|uniref:Type I Iterative PKS n=1 Tax=Diaporthe eres TaxID=83184 RepID=A0ABR1NM37_DIAER
MVPPERWNASAHVGNTSAKNVSGTGFGCWLDQAAQFDAAYFNMSPREAAQVDPAQRLALLAATEALELAGIVPNRTPSTHKKRVGVWFGCTSNDWMETNSAQNIDTYFIPGGNRAFIPGRINYHFKFSGPSFTIDTACSSSLAALHMACNALWRGEVDTAIVGGTNVLTNPDMTAGLDRGHFLSRTGNCKTFDDGADGYCRGEAVVTIILKRLDDAVADKDPVQACIPPRGVATNHNAEAESITRPHAAAQKELFEHLLSATGVRASDISYVEMHGTGTQAGDFGETTSVVTTLSPIDSLGNCLRPNDQPLHIGAVKSNVGHGEAAAGVTSLAKVLLMLKHNTIPPHIGVKTKLNHRLPDLRAHNTRIATAATPWEKPEDGIRRVLLNNFSAAGGNTAIILEDPSVHGLHGIPVPVSDPDPRRFHIVTISGKTSEALLANLRNTVAWIDRTASTSSDVNILAKLSYTTTARRMHHRYRVAVTATDLRHARTLLQKQVDQRSNGEKSSPVAAKAPRFLFCFTGQGSPYAGMGADLFARFASFRADVRQYDHTCVQLGLPPILSFFETDRATGSLDGISPVVLQLSHVCFQMALFRLWKSFGVEPATVVGHSLGEYAALYAAGSLTQTSVIHLVGRRAQLMDKYLDAGAYTMLVAMAGEHKVEATLAGHNVTYEISCRNGRNNTVIGGTTAQISAARPVLEAGGINCHALDSPFAFHTSQADPILGHLLRVSDACPIQPPSIPVISPTKGKVLYSPEDFGEGYFVKHCRHSVNMLQALTNASSEGLIDTKTVGIEIGPAPVVMRMAKEVVGPSMQTFASVHKAMDTWQSVYADIAMMIGNYTEQVLGLDKDKITMEIADMHIMAALVTNDVGNEQTLRTSAKLDKDTKSLLCSFLSVDSNGKENQLHATCSVRFAELKAIKTQFEEAAFTARERIHSLADKSREPDSNTYRFSAAMIYKMVGQLADFAPKYRGLSAITLDNDALEAAGTISFRSTASDSDSLWFMSPAYLDAFSQLGGFVMNANEEVDLDKELFVNHGWASMALFRPQLDPKATYHSYVKMNEGKGNLWSGDVLIFDEQYELIGVIGGVALQGVQKRLMEYIIKSANKKVSSAVPTSRPSERAPVTVEVENLPAKPVVKVEIQPDPAVVIIEQKEAQVPTTDPWQTVLDILSEESGVDKSELDDDVSLADIGIDSLLSLVVCGRLRDDLDVNLPDGALFQECYSVGDIKKRVPGAGGAAMPTTPTPTSSVQDCSDSHDISQEDANSASSDSETTNSDLSASPSDLISDETPLTPSLFFRDDKFSPQVTSVELSRDEEPMKPAWSLYLQGSRKRSSSTLFLLPDGCGAATSYMDLPPVSPSLALVGFNSPFMKTPHLMYEHTLAQVLHSYLAGIRARQPHGPYHLGGWSAGGILAYALAAQLLEAGEAVASLTLIDSPPPDRGLDHLPERFFSHCTRVGVFGTEMARGQNEAVAGGGKKDHKTLTPPEWLLPHFRATIDLLHDYHAPPLSV